MARNEKTAQAPKANESSVTPSPELAALLEKTRRLLDEGQARKALDILVRDKGNTAEVRNAIGVCLLRLGDHGRAVEHFRSMALASGFSMRRDLPIAVKTNFATALLAGGNIAGCCSTLDEIRDEQNPTVQKLRATIGRWKSNLPLGKKVQWYLGGEVNHPVVLDFVPGEL